MKRQLIPEAFVNQKETIDKTLIEAHNQPSSYYTRRNRRQGNNNNNNVNGGVYGMNQNVNNMNNMSNMGVRMWNQMPQGNAASVPLGASSSMNMGMDVYGFRGGQSQSQGAVPSQGGLQNNVGVGAGGFIHVPQIFDDQPVSKPSASSVSSNNSDGSPVDPLLGTKTISPVTGSLLPGQNTAGSNHSGGSISTGNVVGGGLSTFDPFEKDHLKDPLWSFNSSNNFLGGNFAPSSNIWGDNSKTDAAVWG
ncbi:hypothetical protein ACI3LY_000654 [Candidozyma auris]|uniref:Uncharacterized protein n=2 Tax=Candidozyma auris TaxID=498019 RepID=A0A2H1A376_CANAR|nr:hypothetical_protein [[Candida] auris]KND95757.2 hypothetical protein QG37_08087 [[Candida] auris]PIS57367.1 hypothetical protein CJI97_000403 [[Candida] auris]PIS58944.1 hypothetical protein B9J08_000403 [[Candida] auris]QEO20318.1 hypothetical_protein [[Candida] auris]QWW23231.1 hypothetical protein CA7LBN_002032 [[Candida] auris]